MKLGSPRPGRRCRPAWGALLLALALTGCRGGRVGKYSQAPVILISIDTLRADHLPIYGYAAGSTPHIDALAREGVVFEDAYSQVPLTLPSHTTLLTGLLPPHHGVRDNMGFTLKPEHRTLATRLKAAGAATGAAISAYVLRRQTGISQGFDFYDDELEIKGGTESLGAIQRDGARAVASLTRWVDDHASGRFFAFLHLYEPHSPYEPPPEFDRFPARYDGEIAYADALVGRFLDHLKARGILDRALVVLVSDHGEGLGEHGEAEHGIFLYREEMHVPLIVRLPGGARGGTRVRGTVGLDDVAPTILDLAGLPAGGMDGHSLREALVEGTAKDERVYSETLFPRYHFGWSDLYAATEGSLRYIRAPRPELYDLGPDPHELKNLASSRAATAADMEHWLDARRGEAAAPEAESAEVRRKLEALGYVGVASAPPPEGDLPDPKDRIGSYEELKRGLALRQKGRDADAVPIFRKVLAENPRMLDAWEVLGTTLVRLGRAKEGIKALTRALEIDPGRATTHIALVRAYATAGRLDMALEHGKLAAATDPAQGYEVLAQLMLDEKRLDLAAEFARKSLAADPGRMMSHFVLGVTAQEAGRFEEAVGQFRQAEEAKKRRPNAIVRGLHSRMATCLGYLGRNAEAEKEFRAEIEAIPYSREARQGLAALYWSEGKDAEARAVLTGLLDAEPHPDADTYWAIVHTFAVLGDTASARDWAARARRLYPDDARFGGGAKS